MAQGYTTPADAQTMTVNATPRDEREQVLADLINSERDLSHLREELEGIEAQREKTRERAEDLQKRCAEARERLASLIGYGPEKVLER